MKTSTRQDLWKSFLISVQIMVVFLVFGFSIVFIESLTTPLYKTIGMSTWIFSAIWLLVFAIRRYLS